MLRRARRLLNQAALGDNVGGVQARREPIFQERSSPGVAAASLMLALSRTRLSRSDACLARPAGTD